MDGTDADGILMSPVHARLLAPSGNEDPSCCLDALGSDEEAFASEFLFVA